MRRRDGVGVPGTPGDAAVRRELQDRRREELKTGLVLREVDRAPGAGARPALERGEHRDRPVPDGDVVDVRAVQEHRRRVRLAQQLDEAGERAQLATVARVEGMRPRLALVAARQDHELRMFGAERVRAEAEPGHRPRGEALDEYVGETDERPRERDTLRMLEVERRAALPVVVEGEHAGVIRLDDPVLERRIRRPEDVGRETALETDDLRAEVREVLAHERPGRGEAHLHDAQPAQRPGARGRRGSRRGVGHTVPARRRRSSSSVATPASA